MKGVKKLKNIKDIEAEIKNNNTRLNIEDYMRFIECETVTKLDIQFIGCGYRISGSRWHTKSDCDFIFIYESHKQELQKALCDLAIGIANNTIELRK